MTDLTQSNRRGHQNPLIQDQNLIIATTTGPIVNMTEENVIIKMTHTHETAAMMIVIITTLDRGQTEDLSGMLGGNGTVRPKK